MPCARSHGSASPCDVVRARVRDMLANTNLTLNLTPDPTTRCTASPPRSSPRPSAGVLSRRLPRRSSCARRSLPPPRARPVPARTPRPHSSSRRSSLTCSSRGAPSSCARVRRPTDRARRSRHEALDRPRSHRWCVGVRAQAHAGRSHVACFCYEGAGLARREAAYQYGRRAHCFACGVWSLAGRWPALPLGLAPFLNNRALYLFFIILSQSRAAWSSSRWFILSRFLSVCR